MKKLFFLLTFFAALFFQCGKFITSPTPIVATIRLVTPQGSPIVGHELVLAKQFPNKGTYPTDKDEVIEKKLTDSKGEVLFKYDYTVHESTAERWFVTPKDTPNLVAYNYYRHVENLKNQNFTLVLDSLRPIRVRFKNPASNAVSVSAGAASSGDNIFSRSFGVHAFNLGGLKDSTVTFTAFSRSSFFISWSVNQISSKPAVIYNGGLIRDSVFVVTL